MTGLVDAHAHLQHGAFDVDREAVLDRARLAGIDQILVPGWDLASSRAAVALADQHHDLLRPAVGIHPHDVAAATDQDWRELEALAADERVVAVGEIGLDYFRNLSPPEAQRDAFARQLKLATAVRKPVIVHDREAHEDITDTLLAWAASPAAPAAPRGVLHAFSGDLAMARRLSDAGFLVSFALPIAFRSGAGPRATAGELPEGSFVVETDAPYLGPVQGGRNEPTTVLRVAAEVARLRGQTPEAVAAAANAALRRMLRDPRITAAGTRLANSVSGPASGHGNDSEISDKGGSEGP